MCASPAAEVESREKRVCGLTDRKAGNLDTYIKGVEGTILVAGRWAVPDRPPASWYGTRLSAGAAFDIHVSAFGKQVDISHHVIQACYNMIVAVVPRLTWSGARMITSGGDVVDVCHQANSARCPGPSPAPQSVIIPCTDQSRHDFPVCI